MSALLIHPVGLDRTTWDHVPVPDARTVDLPGHGMSPWIPVASLQDVADDVSRQIEPSGEALDIIGVSLGGMVALHLALRHPERVRSLFIACAPAASPREVLLARAEMTDSVGMEGTLDMTVERWFSAEQLAGRARIVRDTERRLRRDDAAIIAQYWRLMAEHDVRAQLAEIGAPTTALAALQDRSTSPERMSELARGVALGRYAELDGPHMIHLSDPGGFAGAVEAHLAWVDGL